MNLLTLSAAFSGSFSIGVNHMNVLCVEPDFYYSVMYRSSTLNRAFVSRMS